MILMEFFATVVSMYQLKSIDKNVLVFWAMVIIYMGLLICVLYNKLPTVQILQCRKDVWWLTEGMEE